MIFCLVIAVLGTADFLIRPDSSYELDINKPAMVVGASQDNTLNTEALKNVKREFDKIESVEDRETIHKLFSGSASFLTTCKSLKGTYQFSPILGRVQSSYGWNREKYPKFTDAVSDYLVEVGYDEPKQLITTRERLDFAQIFIDLSKATTYAGKQ